MIQTQSELDLFTPPAPPVGEIDRLCNYLAERPQWVRAKQIQADLGINERKIRQLAELSNGRIVSGPGCPGYRHFDHCTCEQLRHVANQLFSQGRAMIRRSIRLKKLAHETIQ